MAGIAAATGLYGVTQALQADVGDAPATAGGMHTHGTRQTLSMDQPGATSTSGRSKEAGSSSDSHPCHIRWPGFRQQLQQALLPRIAQCEAPPPSSPGSSSSGGGGDSSSMPQALLEVQAVLSSAWGEAQQELDRLNARMPAGALQLQVRMSCMLHAAPRCCRYFHEDGFQRSPLNSPPPPGTPGLTYTRSSWCGVEGEV